MSPWRAAAALLPLAATLSAPALATEGGTGHYLLGSRDSLSGIVPPPGVYLSADFIGVDAGIDRLPIGGAVLGDASTRIFLTKINFTKSFHGAILGGRPMVSFTQPIATGELEFGGVLGRTTLRARDSQTGLGDTVITAGLGWDDGPNHIAFQTSVFLPLGYFEPVRVDIAGRTVDALSFSKNRFGFTPVVSFTRLPPTGLELSGAVGLSFSTRNRATDYQTAPEFHVEGALAQHFSKQIRAGIAGYAYKQLGEDSGRGADQLRAVLGASSLKARVFGFGPVIGYSSKLGALSLTLKAKYTHEFGSRNRLEGDMLQLSVAVGF